MNHSSRRWAAAGGFAFVALFIAAALLLGGQLGSAGDPDRQFASHFSDTSARVRDIAGAYILIAAGLAFVAFIANLHAVLAERLGQRPLPLAAFGAGLIFVTLLFAAAAALSAVPTSLAYAAIFDEERHEFGPDVSRLATQFGFMLLVFAVGRCRLYRGALRGCEEGGYVPWLASGPWHRCGVRALLQLLLFAIGGVAHLGCRRERLAPRIKC